jgi:2-C-methyl-D-erythritol 4-phosphate cytidylyltransferase
MPRWALLIPAAGAGRRMGGKEKPLLRFRGRTLLAWALDSFRGFRDVVIAVPPGEVARWMKRLRVRATFVEGGMRRQDSVQAALAAVPGATHVLVHDAARPFPGRALVLRVMLATLKSGAAVPGLPVSDTLKVVEEDLVKDTLPREKLWRVQTPQGARADWLREAFARAERGAWEVTDESMLLEKCGRPVRIVAGDPANVKVTTPADWKLLRRGGIR